MWYWNCYNKLAARLIQWNWMLSVQLVWNSASCFREPSASLFCIDSSGHPRLLSFLHTGTCSTLHSNRKMGLCPNIFYTALTVLQGSDCCCKNCGSSIKAFVLAWLPHFDEGKRGKRNAHLGTYIYVHVEEPDMIKIQSLWVLTKSLLLFWKPWNRI